MLQLVAGICWPHAGTVGCATVASKHISGEFPSTAGDDARVACDLVAAGKYRNGAARAWCRTHQQYWGVKADLAALQDTGIRRCARYAEPMGYVLEPYVLELKKYAHVAVTLCNDGYLLVSARPGVELRCKAIAIACNPADGLFNNREIIQLNVTPVMVHAWQAALQTGTQMGCADCARCGHPHLDLGSFSMRAHRRHYCGNCGNDGTHSAQAIVSTPIFALLNFYGARLHVGGSNVHNNPVL